jgi:hypothetical protein
MDDINQINKTADKPCFRINLKDSDLRTGPKDRRKLHTYLAQDRRSGLADRRKTQSKSNS